MTVMILLGAALAAATGVTITEPADGATYGGDWLPLRAIVENGNQPPDSVDYVLNGGAGVLVPRLSTDWYTYMADDCHNGYSQSPAPVDATILWTAQVTGTYHEFPTPVVVNGIVYYPQDSTGDSLFALDAATGQLIWKYRTGYTDDAVTVKEGLLYTSSDSLWCLDALTGERIWANGDASSAASTPAVSGGSVYCCNESYYTNITTVYSLDALTGQVNWTAQLPGYAASCLTIWNGMLFVPTWHGPIYALEASSGQTLWQNEDSPTGYWDSSPVIVEGMLYILGDDSKARALDPLTGLSQWETSITPGTYLSATPAYYDGKLYFGDQVDSFHCLDGPTGGFVWSVPGVEHGSPGVADGMVFYGESSNYYDETAHVYALNCQNGQVVWSYDTVSGPYGIVSSPSITDGVVYIAGTDGNLYAFGTGLKYTYLDDLLAQVGSNQLIVTSYYEGAAAASDTVNFTVTGAGLTLEPSGVFGLGVSPNPFTASSTIRFETGSAGQVSLSIYDLAGREVVSLVDGELSPGLHQAVWNGSDRNGVQVPSGLYLCRMEFAGTVETAGLCLLR